MKQAHIKSKKFGRQKDQRQALILGLADALVINQSIETTLPKAKIIVSHTEKLITKAKKNDLHNRRLVMQGLATKEAANKLVDDIAPKLTGRSSGYFRIERTKLRRGDNAQLAKVSFVDDLSEKKPAAEAKKADEKTQTAKDAPKNPSNPRKKPQ